MTTIQTLSLSDICDEAMDYVDEARPLNPATAKPRVIVELVGKSHYIVDGFHRTAGMVKYCKQNDIDLSECKVSVVVCDDSALIRVAAEPGEGQDEALAAIYAQVGL